MSGAAAPARPWSRYAWLLAWLPAMLASMFAHGPMPLYSTRTLAVGWDMWRLGEWLVPHLNGVPYSHKTPLLYWLYHAGWALTGVNDAWPRVLHVLIATAAIALTAALARRLFSQRAAVAELVPWALLGLAFFVLYALQLMFDMLLAVWVLLALLALVRGGIDHGRPHWPLFALAVWLGLMTKGPVMLLHVAFPLLLAPWWSAAARAAPARWYGGAALALLAALAAFAAWVIPAALRGGAEYRDLLLWKQTAGRVVASFDHARSWWWYLALLPAILFPWLLWPTGWRAQFAARASLREPGMRFLLIWLLPMLAVFSLISGKQAYYLIPELCGFAIVVAVAIAAWRAPDSRPLRPWGFALVYIAFGLAIVLLPQIGEYLDPASIWMESVGPIRYAWGGGIVVAGAVLLWPLADARRALVRVATVTLAVLLLAHLQFTAVAWPRYDLLPSARALAQAEHEGRPIANLSAYEGQFHFLGRLQTSFAAMSFDEARAWALAHPDGVLVQYPHDPWQGPGKGPLLAQPFRATWLEIWNAHDWLAAFHSHLLRLPEDVAQRSAAYGEALQQAAPRDERPRDGDTTPADRR